MNIRALSAAFLMLAVPSAFAQTKPQTVWPNQHEGDFIIKDFRFKDGETIAELKQHYMTLGTPKRNAAGEITNAVILLHGTSSSGEAWLMPSLADELFAAGQPLDAAQYFIILPDGIGRGGSSKPSDACAAGFPIIVMTTSSPPSTSSSPRGSASSICASSWARRWAACTRGCGVTCIPT
jgi:homoserine O-acetyltransferase/O-succinyltransferase